MARLPLIAAAFALSVSSACIDRRRTENAADRAGEADKNELAEIQAAWKNEVQTNGAGNNANPTRVSNWSYTTDRDEARNAEIRFATITSSNSVNFDFPYQGGSSAQLTVRQHPQHGLDIYITVRPSQFLCNSYAGCRGLINVDGRPEPLSLIGPEDQSIDVVFVRNGRAILGKLRNSERVIVELPFYQGGNRQFTFETAGLEWR